MNICCICQVSGKENVLSSTNGYKTLAKNILEFHRKGKLGFHFERICNPNSDLSVSTTNKAVYHHNCFSKYSDLKLKCLNEPSKTWKCTKGEKGRKSTPLSADSRERFDLFCCWCSKKGVDANLVPAGIYQATKLTTKLNHMKDLTAKWIEMVTKLNHEPVSHLLSSGDVASNKFYYHEKFYDTIRYQYSKFTKSEFDESSSMHDAEWKQIASSQVLFEIQQNVSNDGA